MATIVVKESPFDQMIGLQRSYVRQKRSRSTPRTYLPSALLENRPYGHLRTQYRRCNQDDAPSFQRLTRRIIGNATSFGPRSNSMKSRCFDVCEEL